MYYILSSRSKKHPKVLPTHNLGQHIDNPLLSLIHTVKMDEEFQLCTASPVSSACFLILQCMEKRKVKMFLPRHQNLHDRFLPVHPLFCRPEYSWGPFIFDFGYARKRLHSMYYKLCACLVIHKYCTVKSMAKFKKIRCKAI